MTKNRITSPIPTITSPSRTINHMFELIRKHRAHGMNAVESHTLTPEQVDRVRDFIHVNYENHPFYKCKRVASPFLQGCDEHTDDGAVNWVLIEFWSQNEPAILECIRLLNGYVFNGITPEFEFKE